MNQGLGFVLHGQLYSKANNRQAGVNRRSGKLYNRKSPQAQDCVKFYLQQLKKKWGNLSTIEGPIRIGVDVYHSNKKFDLDVQLLMDILQKAKVIKNDRQVMAIATVKRFDKRDPRCEVSIFAFTGSEHVSSAEMLQVIPNV